MSLKQNLSNLSKFAIASFGLGFIFFTTIEFMFFLSDPNYQMKTTIYKDIYISTSYGLLQDTFLLSLFILQHSLLATSKVKKVIANHGLQDIYRSFYIIATAITLQIIIRHWQSIPELTLWKFNLNYKPFWWLYMFIHVLAWLIIYIGNVCKDVTELLGIKQVYYSSMNLPDPNLQKSRQLQRLNEHMRHPSFLAFLLIFWINPIMSLDRLLLASIMTYYMYFTWNTDDYDYAYQQNQYRKKFFELEKLD